MPRSVSTVLTISLSLLLFSSSLYAIEEPGEVLGDIVPTTQLGKKIDLSLRFNNAEGKAVTLRELIKAGRPALLFPVYYHCPRMCGLALTGLTTLLNQIELALGADFQVITVSFDTSEQSDLASERKEHYLSLLKPSQQKGEAWHFLVGDEANVSALMQQIGFKYRADQGEFVHTSQLILLTPQGEISQYFTGIEYPAWDVRLALIEASKGSIGSALDHVFLFCFRFDSLKGRYIWAVYALLKLGGTLTLLLLGTLIYRLVRRDMNLQKRAS